MPALRSAFALLLSLAATAAATQESDYLPAIEHDAGTVFPGVVLKHQFVIENPDAQAWTITGLHSSCSCSAAKPDSLVIDPGGSCTVPVVFAVGDTENQPVEAIITADIKRPSGTVHLPMHVVAQVASPIQGPNRVALEPPHHTAAVAIHRGRHPAPWVRLTARVVSGGPILSVGEVTGHEGGWSVPVAAVPGTLSGTFFGRIELSCLDAAGTALPYKPSITAVVRCPGPWSATPGSLLIGTVPPGGTATGTALIRSTGPDLSTARVESSNPRWNATLDAETGRLRVSFRADGSTGSANGWIDLVQGEQRLRIPMIAAVAETLPPTR